LRSQALDIRSLNSIIFNFWEGEEDEEDYVFGRLRYVADGWVGLGHDSTPS
jgi:hypothetical protein